MALDPGTVVGGYRIENMLGRGGMGVVYSARHVELGRQVALKVLADELSSDPGFVARFRREGRLQASLEHPHVVTVYEAGESEHGLYLAMRLVSGSTLAVLVQDRVLDAGQALALLRQVADALDAAHAAGLVHRDVKPQNVLVGDSDDAFLGDFGLTRAGGAEGVTATGDLLGTLSYLAPEVIRGHDAAPASDRYAFAAMVFECLTGSVVFPRPTDAAILYAHTSEPPPRPSQRRGELPEALDHVFAGALSKDPTERPEKASVLVSAVAETLDAAGLAGLGPPPSPGVAALAGWTVEPHLQVESSRPRGPMRRRTVVWLAGAALAGAAVVAAIAALAEDDDGSEAAAVPAALAGAQLLGSDLSEPGRTLDCQGKAPASDSPGCTIVQDELPGQRLVVPEDGVIRRWAVRSARGELLLAVLRPRSGGAFQIARSRNEFVGDGQVHAFKTDLAVEQGDLLGLVVVPGAAVGAGGGADGATTKRWLPSLTGVERAPDFGRRTGFDDELLFRVDYVAGGRQQVPAQVTGAGARALPPGRVVADRTVRVDGGPGVEEALVEVDGGLAIDQFVNRRRSARIEVPDWRPAGRVLAFEVELGGSDPFDVGIYIEYANPESARILSHYYVAGPRAFELVN